MFESEAERGRPYDRGRPPRRRSLSEFRKDRLLSAMTPKREEGQVRIL
jgi:hypothetical protein